MFTGIITDVTEIVGQQHVEAGLKLVFARPASWADLVLGESIATNGVCLTVAELHDDTYSCVLVPETLELTTFGAQVPEKVNLERALKIGDRLSGHMVQGHVDGTAQVTSIDQDDGHRLTVAIGGPNDKFVAPKGSITINGVSLTIAELKGKDVTVALVPHTLEKTTLGELSVGDAVNIEFDAIAKYVERLMNKE